MLEIAMDVLGTSCVCAPDQSKADLLPPSAQRGVEGGSWAAL